MVFKLLLLNKEDLLLFKKDMQEAFQKGFEDVYGKTEEIILPEKDIDNSLNTKGALAYKAAPHRGTFQQKTGVRGVGQQGSSHL